MKSLIIGASGGIGLAFLVQALTSGKYECIYGTYRRLSPALVSLQETYGRRLQLLAVDVAQPEQIQRAIADIQAQTHTLDEVIYAVGLLHEGSLKPEKSLRHIQASQLQRYFEINAIGAILWAQALFPLLRHADSAKFVAISAKIGSIGDNRLGGWYGYRASKAALNMFIKTIAIEWKRMAPNIIVAALHPGTTNTALSRPFQGKVPPGKLFSPERCVTQLRQVIDDLDRTASGEFFSWDGTQLPW